LNPDTIDIDRAHRSGGKGKGPRPIIAKLMNQDSKDKIFKNVKNLRNKPDLKVQEQLPAEVTERRKRLWPKFKSAKENPVNKVSWSLDKLVINGTTFTAFDDMQAIQPSEVSDIDVSHTDHLVEDGSTSMGHAAQVHKKSDISDVMAKILQDRAVAGATHNIYAYRFTSEGRQCEGRKDDGEHGASFKLLKMLRDNDVDNVMVVVTRWFGHKHMGPKRFQCIERSANEALKLISV
jgi:hypothetical protein